MPKSKTPSPNSVASPPVVDLAGIERALDAVVGSGWAEPGVRLDAEKEPVSTLVHEVSKVMAAEGMIPAPVMPATQRRAAPDGPQEVLEYQAHGGALKRVVEPPLPAQRPRDEDQEPEPPNKAILDIGLLSDFVTGARSAEQTAEAAGVTLNELHSALATTLTQVDAKELAKAMGVQVGVTQLKAVAVFNALLADLIEDIRSGRAKADVKLELMKILKGVGRLEPKEDKGVGLGVGGFQLNINIGDGSKPVVIDAK